MSPARSATRHRWHRERQRRYCPHLEPLEDRRLLSAGLDESFVRQVYRDLLGREGEPAGVDYWRDLLEHGISRERVASGFEDSLEHRARQVEALCSGLFRRPADPFLLQIPRIFLPLHHDPVHSPRVRVVGDVEIGRSGVDALPS